jgi:hypothetical protein
MSLRPPRVTLLAPLLLAACSGPGVSALDEGMLARQVTTSRGPLKITRQSAPDGGKIFKITLGSKLIAEEREFDSVYIEAVHPRDKEPALVLLGLGTGGSGCPGYFKIVELTPDGAARITERFGNCSDLFDTKWQDGGWRIDIPRIGGAEAQSWLYRDGKLTRLKPSPRP